jgi:Zn-dependent protease with chaperone function
VFISAEYFDGKSSKKEMVIIKFDDKFITIKGEITDKKIPIKDIIISDRLANTPRQIRFDNGSVAYSSENDKIDKIIDKSSSIIYAVESKMIYVLFSLMIVILAIIFFFTSGANIVANIVAKNIPHSIEKKLSDETLEILDNNILLKSKLSKSKKEHIKKIFSKLTKNSNQYKLHFRRGIGENAFALPSGDIIITDELIVFSKGDDDMIFGVLAHEVGHIEYKHSLKTVVKFSITGAMISYITGDISSLISILGTSVLNANYSRDYEAQADRYAKKRMIEEGIEPKHLANFFIKLEEKELNKQKYNYFASHPSNQKRIDFLLEKDSNY